jgi:MFS family permease
MVAEQDGLPVPQRYWAAATIWLALIISVLDGSIANVALPTIAGDLSAPAAEAVWVVNAYQLAIVVSLLPMAAIGEMVGFLAILKERRDPQLSGQKNRSAIRIIGKHDRRIAVIVNFPRVVLPLAMSVAKPIGHLRKPPFALAMVLVSSTMTVGEPWDIPINAFFRHPIRLLMLVFGPKPAKPR